MKKLAYAVLCCAPLVASAQPAEGRFAVMVNRKAQDVYVEARTKTVILTRYCYEYAYSDDAILIWKGKFGDSKIVFSSGEVCEVKEVL